MNCIITNYCSHFHLPPRKKTQLYNDLAVQMFTMGACRKGYFRNVTCTLS